LFSLAAGSTLPAINSDRETDMSDPYHRPMFEEIILPRRTPTRLNAMGSFKLARRAGDIRDGSAPQTPAPKVMIGPQAFPRCDITEGKPGIPLTLTLTIVAAENGLAPDRGRETSRSGTATRTASSRITRASPTRTPRRRRTCAARRPPRALAR
jgi:hypothetical protein